MLKQRGFYLHKRPDGTEIGMLFRTWTFARFCEKNNNMPFPELLELFRSGFTLKAVAELMLSAAEYQCLKDQKPFSFSSLDAYEWIDEMGGLTGAAFYQIISTALESFQDSGEVKIEEGKKKATKK